jgi:putative transposase
MHRVPGCTLKHMHKFKNQYRIPSARLPLWDYGSSALYFITICTHHRRHYFGKIEIGKDALPISSLSAIGEIVKSEWLKTVELRKDMNVWMGEYIIMPNHFHAIIGIGIKSTDALPYYPIGKGKTKNEFGPQSKNIASILRGFKSAVTTAARKIEHNFQWHPRFHDRIIRNQEEFQRISNYIINNPGKWYRIKSKKIASQ